MRSFKLFSKSLYSLVFFSEAIRLSRSWFSFWSSDLLDFANSEYLKDSNKEINPKKKYHNALRKKNPAINNIKPTIIINQI